tara:strand:- start:140 stop:739 length:600 start_codon:yes stop_codon:yes gene_type:complete
MFLKKNNFYLLLIFVFINIFSLSVESEDSESYYISQVLEYLSNNNEFSSNFLQFNNNSYQEGKLFLKKERIRIEYTSPSKLIIVIKKNQVMYHNVELEEVEYFNPKNTVVKTLYDFFYNKIFFNDVVFIHEKNALVFSKKTMLDDEINIISVIFEESPLNLKKIKIENSQGIMTFTILDPNYNPELDDSLFSLANPLIS